MNLSELSGPFPASKISWRVGATTSNKDKGIAFAYIDARDVMDRLDEVCGIGGWQARYPFAGCCEIGIKTQPTIIEGGKIVDPGEWVWKSNGAGETDVEAEKGQYSDAFKRAAVLWGIGRYLYDVPNKWIPIEQKGRSYGFSNETIAELNQRFETWQAAYFNRGEK